MLAYFILLKFFHLIASYTVIPDEGYYPNATCLHCHNLQYYLQNSSEYFTSNTQLLFLPGLHHLNTDLVIQNVHNVSIIGKNTSSIIQCDLSVGVIMKNITNLAIENMVIRNCLTHSLAIPGAVNLMECNYAKLHYVQIYQLRHTYGYSLQIYNMMGTLYLNHITCNEGMHFQYFQMNTTINYHVIFLEHYSFLDIFSVAHAIFVDLRRFINVSNIKRKN